MDDTSSDDEEEGVSTARIASVFEEENAPDATQAQFAHTSGWNGSKAAKNPKRELLFAGVVINSKDYEFKTRMSRPEADDAFGRAPRQAMGQKARYLKRTTRSTWAKCVTL